MSSTTSTPDIDRKARHTKVRHVRVSDQSWADFAAACEDDGTKMSVELNAFIEAFNAGYRLPARYR